MVIELDEMTKHACKHDMMPWQDGCVDTIKGACTLVVDFTDFCFHSYFSYMDDLIENLGAGEKPIDAKYELLLLQLHVELWYHFTNYFVSFKLLN